MSEEELVDITPEKPSPRAFPCLDDIEFDRGPDSEPLHVLGLVEGGMMLRDFFAAYALQGLFASGKIPGLLDDVPLCTKFASYAWRWADAMLAARGK